jgi:hypothetical protein
LTYFFRVRYYKKTGLVSCIILLWKKINFNHFVTFKVAKQKNASNLNQREQTDAEAVGKKGRTEKLLSFKIHKK